MVVSALLESPFIDERFLFRGYGLSRHQISEFLSIYDEIGPEDRPLLSPYFDPWWYRGVNAPNADASWDPLIHFIHEGFAQRRSPHPLIKLDYIERQFGTFSAGEAGLADLVTSLRTGVIEPSPYFEQRYYLDHSQEAAEFPSGPIGHFLETPSDEVFIPCRLFDVEFYRLRYPDVPHSRRGAFLHFCVIGDRQRRFPSAAFDPDWYYFANRDLALTDVAPLYHFLEYGRKEGRAPLAKAQRLISAAGPTSSEPRKFEVSPFSPEAGRARYEALRDTLIAARHERIGAVIEREARPVTIPDLRRMPRFVVPRSDCPRVSIIIPMFNEVRVTIECLRSIEQSRPQTPIEVIVADDCSTDPDLPKLTKITGIIYIRQERNLNFLRNCNSVLPQCRGDFILLLNNDAQVSAGAIDVLCRELVTCPSVGVVGPKFLFPNGRLQEAGGTIQFDATTEMIGLFDSPDVPSYNYPRDVDYVSGAGLMVRRSLLGDTIFDDDLAPAYCEDEDLCLRVAAQGYRIRYVPEAVIVHHLSVTMSDHGLKIQRIVTNQHRLYMKWSDQLTRMNRVRIIAFYLPQFHPIPENDFWWGKGFTEWTNVSKATPSYQDHYQPHLPADLGFYDLRVPETYLAQADLLRRYGLEGICLYYYNFSGKTFLSQPLEIILGHPEIGLNFCLCWANENWSRRWDGGSRDLLLEQLYDARTIKGIACDLVKAARDPRYIKVDGRPVFLVYRPLIIPDVAKVMAQLRREAQAVLGSDLHLVFVESMESVGENVDPCNYGFDAAVEFPPHGIGVPASDRREPLKAGWNGERYDYEKTVCKAILRPGVGWKRYPSVFPSWDNTARQSLQSTSFDHCSPEVFKLYVEEKIAECRRSFVGDERLLFVNAWNEWAEGTHLEPDMAYGHSWLEAVRQALRDRAWFA